MEKPKTPITVIIVAAFLFFAGTRHFRNAISMVGAGLKPAPIKKTCILRFSIELTIQYKTLALMLETY